MSNSTRPKSPHKFNPSKVVYNPSNFERKYNHALAEAYKWKEALKQKCSKPKRSWLEFELQRAIREVRWFESKLGWKYTS